MTLVSRTFLLVLAVCASLAPFSIHAQQTGRPQPTITSFTPASATAGTRVVIRGTNFTGIAAVRFGTSSTASVAAKTFTVDSPTHITAIVGTGASGSVFVLSAGGTASRAGFTFIVPSHSMNIGAIHIS
jgi:hypothetical protein